MHPFSLDACSALTSSRAELDLEHDFAEHHNLLYYVIFRFFNSNWDLFRSVRSMRRNQLFRGNVL